MKRKKMRRLVAEVLDARASMVGPTAVTFRTLGVRFADKSIVLDGDRIKIDAEGVDIPILSGDVVFIPSGAVRLGRP